jgi:hypothetical protein
VQVLNSGFSKKKNYGYPKLTRGVVAEPYDLSTLNLFFADSQVTVFFYVLSLLSTFCTGIVISFFVKQVFVNLLFLL